MGKDNEPGALDQVKTVMDGDAKEDDRWNAGRGLLQKVLKKAEKIPGIGTIVKVGNKINDGLDKVDEYVPGLTAHPVTGAPGRTLRERAGDKIIGIRAGQTDQERMDAKARNVAMVGDPRTTGGKIRAFVNVLRATPGALVDSAGEAAGEAAAHGVLKAKKLLGLDDHATNGYQDKAGDETRKPGENEKVIYVGANQTRKIVPKTESGDGVHPTSSSTPAAAAPAPASEPAAGDTTPSGAPVEQPSENPQPAESREPAGMESP